MPPKQKAAGSQQSRPITSFFQPRPTSDTKPPAPTTAAAPSSSPSGIRPPSSPLDLPSSPLAGGTPSRRQQNAPLSRDTVFAASDDDDGADEDDDDDFLEDLMAKFDPKRAARQATPEPELPAPGLLETPKAKRIMTGTDRILSSPLTLNQKRRPRQFDMSTLMEDALRDDATTASSLENKRAEEAAAAEAAAAVAAAADSDARDKVLLDIVQGGGEGVDAHRVLRAVHRSSRGGKAQLRYCFFRTGYTLPEAPVLTKKKRPTGPWAPLVHDDPRVREQYLASGMPQVLIDRLGGDALPGELFDWILDDLCGQPSRVAQQEYVSLLSCCPGHVRERLTPQRLREVFDRLGADDHEEKDKEHGEESSRQPFPLSRHEGDPYQGRDWSPLRSVMEMLAFAAPDMPPESVAYAARALLRMAMDRFLICCPDVLPEHEFAMQRLLDALPGSSWDKFCAETTDMLYAGFPTQSIRTNALLSLPISTRRTHELRRRLAVSFFFGDASLGAQNPDAVVTVRRVIDRLVGGAEFAVGPDTDYNELRAAVLLLNIAVDDGSFVAPKTSGGSSEEEKQFNADVDELATRLRDIWRRINDAGIKLARTEAKSVIEWVQQRLAHSVRTRRKPRKSVFDVARPAGDAGLPQQRNYMRNFLSKQVGKPTGKPVDQGSAA